MDVPRYTRYDTVLDALRTTPNEWVALRTFNNPRTAGVSACRLRKLWPEYEFKASKEVVSARWVVNG